VEKATCVVMLELDKAPGNKPLNFRQVQPCCDWPCKI
jgi:hypothetical protein